MRPRVVKRGIEDFATIEDGKHNRYLCYILDKISKQYFYLST